MLRQFITIIFFACSIILSAQSERITMFDASCHGSDNRTESPICVNFENEVINITSDSIITNATVALFDEDNNLIERYSNLTISTSAITLNGVNNHSFFSISVSYENKMYYGLRSETNIDGETAIFIANRSFPNTKMDYYAERVYVDNSSTSIIYWYVYAAEHNENHLMQDPCYVFYINAMDDPDSYSPPSVLTNSYLGDVIMNAEYTWTSQPYGSNASLKPNITVSSEQNDEANHTYAIIYNAAKDKYHNYEEKWNDCLFMYQTLVNKFHVPSSNIKVLSGCGNSSIPDMFNANRTQFIPTFLDIDGDNQSDVLKANQQNLVNCINGFSGLTSRDHILLFITGQQDNAQGCFEAWDKTSMSMWFITLGCSSRLQEARTFNVFVGTSWLSLNSIYYEEDSGKDLVVTNICGSNESPAYCSDKPYTDVTYQWLCALNEMDIHASGGNNQQSPYIIINNDTFGSDANNNGIVTMEEAYNYATSHSEGTYTSSMYSSRNYIKDLAFNFIPHNRDLYMCDAINDGGIEFGTTASSIINHYDSWNSPDIYLRNQDDGMQTQTHQPLVIDGPNDKAYIYVRISNKDENYLGEGQYIQLYWACSLISGIAKSAPIGQFPIGGGTPLDYSSLYGTVGVKLIDTTITYGGNSIMKFEWNIPETLSSFINQHSTVPISFMAIISKDSTAICSDLADVQHYASRTQQMRTIAMKDISNVQIANNQNEVTLFLQKTDNDSQNYDYQVLCNDADGYADPSSVTVTTTDGEDYIIAEIQFETNNNVENEKYLMNVIKKDKETGVVVRGMALEVERTVVDATSSSNESQNSIANISINNGNSNIIVYLTNGASEDTSVRLDVIGPSSFSRNATIANGNTNISFDNIEFSNGIVLVTLIKDGKIIDSKKIIQ
ncbi:MAG: hypothetical protein IKH22_11910 [Prevotella sp.]|nr:hypothetical protein [Prevotella sp.]